MKLFETKPHIFLWLSIPFMIIIGYADANENIDINIHDTYYVITNGHLLGFLCLYFAVLGLIYWAMIRSGLKPIGWMTITHLICTIDTLFFIWLISVFDWFTYSGPEYVHIQGKQVMVMVYCLLLFLLGQVIFVLNLLITLIFRKSEITG